MDRNLRIRMLIGTKPRAAQTLKATRDRLKEIERAQTDVAGFREPRSKSLTCARRSPPALICAAAGRPPGFRFTTSQG